MRRGGNVRKEMRKQTMDTLAQGFNSKPGVVKINSRNTFEHELAKFLLAWEILQNDDEFVTEAIFHSGKRADILSLHDGEAWEVVVSESIRSIKEKEDTYPVPVRAFKARTVIRARKELYEILGVEKPQ